MAAVRALLFTILVAAGLAAVQGRPAAAEPGDETSPGFSRTTLSMLSHSVLVRLWLEHPDRAPEKLRPSIETLLRARAGESRARGHPAPEEVPLFNDDAAGLPQNEESVAVCRSDPRLVLGGTNDYRGLLTANKDNLGGWQLSTNGGASLRKEGLLPPVRAAGGSVPSGGDPVMMMDDDCVMYAANINYTFRDDGSTRRSAISLYRTTVDDLTAGRCSGTAGACWPRRRAAAVTTQRDEFLDKEWMAVGGGWVWVTYTQIVSNPNDPSKERGSIRAVRCSPNLRSCSDPILISGADPITQFSYVTVGPDGRTYVSWIRADQDRRTGAWTFTLKLRIALSGSTSFGPVRTVGVLANAIPFDGHIPAAAFRMASIPQMAVRTVAGNARVFLTWDECTRRILNNSCQDPVIRLAFSDDDGETWTTRTLSAGGDNFFPTIGDDTAGNRIAVAWYTTRFDEDYGHQYDVELAWVDPRTGRALIRQRLTPASNEPDADPFLLGLFIGDYFQVFAHEGTAYVHFNANYTTMPFLGEGARVHQMDNYLVTTGPP